MLKLFSKATLPTCALFLTGLCNYSNAVAAQSPTVSPLEIAAISATNGGTETVREPDVTMASPTLGMCNFLNNSIAYSMWDGASWTQLSYTDGGGDPSVAYDAAANRFVSCFFKKGAEPGVWMNWFDVGSGTFLGPRRIIEGTVDKPWLERGEHQGARQELYLTYLKTAMQGGSGRFGRSPNGGQSWVTGSAPGGKFCNHASVASPNGAPLYVAHVFGLGWSVGEGVDQSDGGLQFTPLVDSNGAAIKITPATTSGGNILDSKIPGPSATKRVPYVAADPSNPDRVYVVYYDNPGGGDDVDVMCARADRNPATGTWVLTQHVRVNDDTPGSDDKDQFCPAAVVDDQGRVHVVFYDDRNYDQSDGEAQALFDAYYAYSTDGGTTFTNIRLTPAPYEPALDYHLINDPHGNSIVPGEYPGIAYWGGTVLVTLAGTWSSSPVPNKGVIWGASITF
jgi:hypothetical protein